MHDLSHDDLSIGKFRCPGEAGRKPKSKEIDGEEVFLA